jgi:hypothetical protein
VGILTMLVVGVKREDSRQDNRRKSCPSSASSTVRLRANALTGVMSPSPSVVSDVRL